MVILKENEEQIVNFGVFNYDARKMANILDVPQSEIEAELMDEDSEFSKLLQKGRDMSDYVIDLKLFEMAKAGDIKALDKLDSRKKMKHETKRNGGPLGKTAERPFQLCPPRDSHPEKLF